MGDLDLSEEAARWISPKYKLDLTAFTKAPDGARLYRIVALRSFGAVEKGEIGGFVEGENNLSHRGNCWIAGNAMVRQQAQVQHDSLACDYVDIHGNAQLLDQTLACNRADIGGKVKMTDSSTAAEFTRLFGSFETRDQSRMGGHSVGSGLAVVSGNRHIGGHCVLGGTFHIGGEGLLDGGTWNGKKENDEVSAAIVGFSPAAAMTQSL